MSNDQKVLPDLSFLKDLTDIVKNRTLFFVPFFGAFIAFIVAKADYIKEANVVIWLFLTAIFLVSIRYVYLVSTFLWLNESCRVVFNFQKIGVDPWPNKEKDLATMGDALKLIPEMLAREHWWWRKVMLLMYLGAFTILCDMFVGKYVSAKIAAALAHWLQ